MTSNESIVQLVRERALERREEAFRLASGQMSHDYIDGKRAVGGAGELRLVARAIIELASESGEDFEAVGGLTMGADPLAVAVALEADRSWFSVRKEAKKHGKQKRIEGCPITDGMAVLLLDDVVTTGGSIEQALDAVEEMGGRVVLAVAFVDRGDAAAARLAARGIRYRPLVTYRDLGIEPVIDARVGV